MVDEKAIFKSVVLEVRPRLQSVNVLISLFTDFDDLKIALKDDSFDIITDKTTKISCQNLKIVPNSISSLTVTKTYISFRFRTVNKVEEWDSFKIELLKISDSISLPRSNLSQIFLDDNKTYEIQCKNCLCDLSQRIKFARILPLPSDNSEPSDWFCHAKSLNYDLNPKENDIFYANCYCHISRSLARNTLCNEKNVVCGRCLAWIGVAKNLQTLKIWFNTVRFKHERDSHTTCPLQDIFLTLRDILGTVLFNTAKILLSCQNSAKDVDFIFLWILEKELTVKIVDGGVRDCPVAKVLFKYESCANESVKIWENDSNVVCVDVSKPMAVEILKHLHRFNKIFPKEFSESNGFFISYILLHNNRD